MMHRGSSTLIAVLALTQLSISVSSAFILQHDVQLFRQCHRNFRPTISTQKHMASSTTVNLPSFFHSFGGQSPLVPIPSGSAHLQDHGVVSNLMAFEPTWTMWLSDSSFDNEIPLFVILPTIFLLGSISAFIYANLVYTPEIVENAERIRQEIRDEEIQKLINVVQQHIMEGKDLEELRRPLEFALDMTIEDYVASVAAESAQDSVVSNTTMGGSDAPPFRSTNSGDAKLAAILASHIQPI